MAKQSPNPTIPSAEVTATKFVPVINEITDEVSYATLGQIAALTAPAASATAAGVVELATDAETTTGTDTARVTTPANVKAAIDARATSTSAAGIVELATSAETITGTDTARAVTPEAGAAAYAKLTELVNVVAASGAAQTIPAPSVKSNTRLVLTANYTLTFPTAAAGLSLRIVVVQDSTPRTLTFPAAVKWPSGVSPTLSIASGAIDQFAFRCYDGTNWLATVVGQAYA